MHISPPTPHAIFITVPPIPLEENHRRRKGEKKEEEEYKIKYLNQRRREMFFFFYLSCWRKAKKEWNNKQDFTPLIYSVIKACGVKSWAKTCGSTYFLPLSVRLYSIPDRLRSDYAILLYFLIIQTGPHQVKEKSGKRYSYDITNTLDFSCTFLFYF